MAPTSCTYVGAFTFIRECFTTRFESFSKMRWKVDFSFNVKGGRCETAEGNGVIAN